MTKVLVNISPPNLKCPNCDSFMIGYNCWACEVEVDEPIAEWGCPVCGARWEEREEEKA